MTDYRGFRIKDVVAIVGIGDDDEEGIPAWHTPAGPLPLIGTDRIRVEQLKIMAQEIADETGKNFKVVRFSVREEIGEIISKKATRQ